jgi:hypothetical protein
MFAVVDTLYAPHPVTGVCASEERSRATTTLQFRKR